MKFLIQAVSLACTCLFTVLSGCGPSVAGAQDVNDSAGPDLAGPVPAEPARSEPRSRIVLPTSLRFPRSETLEVQSAAGWLESAWFYNTGTPPVVFLEPAPEKAFVTVKERYQSLQEFMEDMQSQTVSYRWRFTDEGVFITRAHDSVFAMRLSAIPAQSVKVCDALRIISAAMGRRGEGMGCVFTRSNYWREPFGDFSAQVLMLEVSQGATLEFVLRKLWRAIDHPAGLTIAERSFARDIPFAWSVRQ